MSSPEYRDDVENHPELIPGYEYGTGNAATSPLTLDDLRELKITVGLTDDDEPALRAAGMVLVRHYLAAGSQSEQQVDEMHAVFTKTVLLHVTVWTRACTAATEW